VVTGALHRTLEIGTGYGAVKTVMEALSCCRQDARYVVGPDAGQLVMLCGLPQRLRGRLQMNNVGLRPRRVRRGVAG
jgi:hypothetical protein